MRNEIIHYLRHLTKKEKEHCIKSIEECLQDVKDEDHDVIYQEETKNCFEREVLTKYDLFHKQNFFIYKISKHIVEILMTTSNFLIYGGYLRDNILHDHMASKFYTRDSYPFLLNSSESFAYYNDPKIDGDTSMRTLVPKDIDIVFHTFDDFTDFEKKLKAKGYKIMTKFAENDGKYFVDDPKDTLAQKERRKLFVTSNIGINDLSQYDAKLISKDYVSCTVILDITICDKYVPASDFLCNSLLLTSKGFIFRDHICAVERNFFYENVTTAIKDHEIDTMTLKEIQRQIACMEAVISKKDYGCPRIDKHRMQKMITKGWQLIYRNPLGCLSQIKEKDEVDICMICRDDFEEVSNVPGFDRLYDGVKFDCCQCGYHPKCLTKLFERNSPNLLADHATRYVYKCIQCSQKSIHIYDYNDMISYLVNMDFAFRQVKEIDDVF